MNSAVQARDFEIVDGLLTLVRAKDPILDTTYGSGVFWKGSPRHVIGLDLCPDRAKDVCGSFLALPFVKRSFHTVIYDPPFHPYVGSIEEEQYKGMGRNEKELKELFQEGLGECLRVAEAFVIVKCQGYVHNHKPQWMQLWAIDMAGEPFEWLVSHREHKRISGRWKANNSLRRNHSDFLVFSKKGNHR